MKTTLMKYAGSLLLIAGLVFMQSCSSSSDNAVQSGDVEFQITDAPSDDASVKGVFVTVSDIKVDGQSISGFTKQTIDLMAFQEGNAKLMATTRLTSKTYNSLTLVIDTDADATGASPGSYVLSTTDTKYKLRSSGTITITLNNSWNVAANSKSVVILDFNLRKAIRRISDDNVRYNFVSNDNLQASVRVVNQEKAGTVNGNYTEQITTVSDKTIVYAYKKGTYDAGIETQPQGDDAILFKNAVASAEVKGSLNSRTYKLAFIEAGDYELHFATYDIDSNNKSVFLATLVSKITAGGSVNGDYLTVQGGITSSVTTTVTGL